MAVMVILLMIAFIGGSSLSYLLQPGMKNETVAYYGDNLKIKNQDIITARNELDLLKMLKANILLRRTALFRTADFARSCQCPEKNNQDK